MGNAIGKKNKGADKQAQAEAKASQPAAAGKSNASNNSNKSAEAKGESTRTKRKSPKTDTDSSAPSQKKVRALFEEYAGDEDAVREDGLMRLCEDLEVAPEAVEVLILSFHFKAERVCKYTRDEFIEGMLSLGCDSIAKLKAKMATFPDELKSKTRHREIYEWSFSWSKESADKRTIDFDSAEFLLELLLLRDPEQFPLAARVGEFLHEQTSYKAVNQDQWINILDFCTQVDANLWNYDETSSWPVMLDEYVEWLREKDPEQYPTPTRDDGGDHF